MLRSAACALIAVASLLLVLTCNGTSSTDQGLSTPIVGPSTELGGTDAGDAGLRVDGGAPDAGRTDAGTLDAGTTDAGRPDAGAADAGIPDAGVPGPHIKTVFIILMENHDWSEIAGNSQAPYINGTLVPSGAHAEQYYNPPGNHPSLPNYLWLEAGQSFGITDDQDPSVNHQPASTAHLAKQLGAAGISWRAYQEDISGTHCPLTGVNGYAPKHNPFIYFDDVTDSLSSNSTTCINHIRPDSQLQHDLQNGTVAQYNFITPNLCNDMHDCSVGTGDTFLSNTIPMIQASNAYKNGGAIFVVWDESENTDGPIGMLIASPFAKAHYSNSKYYTHSSMLRTMQEIFGLHPFLGDAANATDLSDMFTAFP